MNLLAWVALLWAAPATASEALYLTWLDCPSSPAAVSNLSAPCPITQIQTLIVSFELAQPVDSVIALEATVDVQTASALPAWWQYAPAGCRYGRLNASAQFTGYVACTDFWRGEANFDGPPVYYVGAPRGGPNQARIFVSFAVPSSAYRALAASTRYYAARLQFEDDVATCAGCDMPACLVLNSILLRRLPTATGGDVGIVTPAPGDGNHATWQGTSADCSAVPVQRRTWGQLKSLYR